MRADVASLPQSEATSVSANDEAMLTDLAPILLELKCIRGRKQDRNPPRTGDGSIRVAPKKRQPASLLLQNEASAGHLEMRQLGEESHPEQPT
jgi:hypothetical protein